MYMSNIVTLKRYKQIFALCLFMSFRSFFRNILFAGFKTG